MRVLEIFRKIVTIPHCSGNTAKLRIFIANFARDCGYCVQSDRAGNILCYKNRRDICLQAHYDMVCVGKAPAIELIEKDGYLYAQNSSLGADNGIGVAMMLALMEEGKEAEFLFTNDEEIGLIGAKNLEIDLHATKMINLDSEEFGKIYVGCAGGVDLIAKKDIKYIPATQQNFYKVTSKNFPGGHSGVDIDKDIPNAIKEFAFFVEDAAIGAIEAGERRNSIPVHLQALIATDKKLKSNDFFTVETVQAFEVIDYLLVQTLCAFANGVRSWEKNFNIPQESVNLAKISLQGSELTIEVSLRANSQEKLQRLKSEYGCFFQDWNCQWESEYPAWKPQITPLAKEIREKYLKFSKSVDFAAIHAGLECAIFAQKYPDMQIVSIGPEIENPHSVRERIKIATIEPLYKMLQELL
ncbi:MULTISPECIES: M20/M25/M40 family metallo-hydrolase [unclassified Nitratiruptor]|uniref:M20/M25/M40 family metallo-hydrolase n=1 Tax=unclassified Nitratiruptor TaxID=2624044 RepID=UPI001916B2AE|nr:MULTISPECIES: M20/M25/M40 family metallo-hydrolase [unclassified Nitratiruptor]